MRYTTIIVAAGKGTRMNLGYNKAYYKLNNNKTILETTMKVFLKDDRCKQVIVVTDIQDYSNTIKLENLEKISIVEGGDSRQESVYNGMYAVIEDVVLIHDGARPFISKQVIDDVLNTMKTNDACCVMIPVKDTLKIVKDNHIVSTLDRDTVRFAQTPQAFRFDLLWKCMKLAQKDGFVGTDDASLVEKYSDVNIVGVLGDERNIKITTQSDIIDL